MSSIAVNAITDANDGNTTTINGVTPNVNNVVGKNLVINGAMQIAQRGTSTTGVTSSGFYAVDRFNKSFVTLGTWTISQDTDAPDGFSNSLKLACTTADASPAATDRANIQYRLEGQFLQHLAKGTASAKSVTLSFWVKSNKTGNMQVDFIDNDNTRIIGNTVTINSASTWEKKSITFAGDTSGAFVNDNNLSALIQWWLDSGSDFSSGSVPTSWQAETTIADRNAGGTLALGDSTSNYINITGVQLEVGESATEFEHRPYGIELALCQRYYWRQYFSGSNVIYDRVYWNGAGNNAIFNFPAPAGMRINAATVTCSPTTNGTGVTFTYHPHGNIIVYRVSASGDNYLYAQDLSINAEL